MEIMFEKILTSTGVAVMSAKWSFWLVQESFVAAGTLQRRLESWPLMAQ